MKHKILISYLLIFSFAITLCACGVEFSENGKVAVSNVKSLKNRMNAPDTFMLRDDVLVINDYRDYSGDSSVSCKYIYISYSAKNSFGVPLQDIAVFCDYEYLGSYSEITEYPEISESDYDTKEDFLEANDKRILETKSVSCYCTWQLSHYWGNIPEGSEIIPCKDIAKELGIDYQTDND